jgi:hypothetical protein
MMAYTDLTGLAGVAFALGVILSRLPLISRVAVARGWLVAGIMALALVPVGELSLAGYVRGVSGDLSVTSLLLFGLILRSRAYPQQQGLLLLVAVAALALYPAALGLGNFDPYRLGYGDHYALAVLLLLALWHWVRGNDLIVLALALAVSAWALGGYESANLWDYLIDPWGTIHALFALGGAWLATLKRRGGAR